MQKLHRWREVRREKKKGKMNDQQDNAHSTGADKKQETSVECGEDDGHGRLGMHVLIPKESNEEGVVDFVALHGLNGHYRKTWTATPAVGKPKIWLEDFLPEQIPNARIMSYGYNSTVQFSKSVADIGTFAEQLLHSLIAKRRSHIEKKRPVIFICHSLGGLVFKQGLVRARERDQFDELLQKIRGVVFFGTPHRGSSLADWGTTFGNILKAASLGSSTNSQLSADLKERSEMLLSISKSFVDRSKSLNIISFYETEKADWLNCRVVDEQSAVLGLPDELAIPINGNHQTMCKFSSKDDERYEIVWTNLQELVQKCLAASGRDTISSPEEQRECARCFHRSSLYESYRKLNPDRAPNTCEWILRHEEYERWRQNHQTAFLWMSADAGCGKSVLSSFLVDHLKNEISELETPAMVCHFFIKDNSAQGDATNIVSTILNQIFIDSPGLLQYAFEEYELQASALLESFDALWRILLSLLQDKTRKDIFLLLDGLDECGDLTKERLTQSIFKLYESLVQPSYFQRAGESRSTVRDLPFLKFFITSRPDNLIKEAFRNIPRLRGENEIEAISQDVNLVIRNSLQGLSIPAQFKKKVQTKLINGADQTHLWTSLVLKLLKDALLNAASENDIYSILNNRDIYGLYNHMLRRSSNPVQARLLLQILLAARRPLTLDEMNIALSITPSHQTLASIMSELKHPAENYIFSLCGHFIRVIRSKIYLVHQTAKEFLINYSAAHSHSNSLANAWQNSISIKESNKVLFTICMSRLAMFETEFVSSNGFVLSHEFSEMEGSLFDRSCAQCPLFEYAAEYWPYHYIVAKINPKSVFPAQNKHLCGTPYQGSFSNLEPYLRLWTGQADDEEAFQGLVKSELQAIALHFLSKSKTIRGPDTTKRTGKTILHLAVLSRSIDLIQVLLGRKVPVDATDFDGVSPLSLSLEIADQTNAITEVLLDAGADVNVPDKNLMTALHHVAQDGTVDQIRLLTRNTKANVRLKDRDGETPVKKLIRRPTMDPDTVSAFK